MQGELLVKTELGCHNQAITRSLEKGLEQILL